LEHKKKLGHLPELDSLRTFAVVLVLLSHYLPRLHWPEVPYAWYGVDIFFTISGFLITTILINAADNPKNESKLTIIKNFMIRRVFRLFPLYFLFLILFWALKRYAHLYLWKDEFTPYFFTYTPNWLFYKIGLENGTTFSHLWSLGVEEQFYLFWPWLLLLPAGKLRIYLISFMVLIALFCSIYFYSDTRFHLLTFANFHTLGAGATLAYIYTQQGKLIEWLRKHRMTLFVISFLQLMMVLYFYSEDSPSLHLYRDLSLCICTFCFVLVSVYGWKGIAGYISRNKFMQYIGKISYGVYLFHLPVPALIALLLTKMHVVLPSAALFCLYLTVTFVLSAISYKYLETPFLRLKKRFEN
jgi:peptidoglycan/LPS O-acetylase OafA/YrhL